MTKEQLQSLLEQVHEALATIAMCDDLTFDRCQEIVAEAYVPLDEALALVRGSSEPREPLWPGCDQNGTGYHRPQNDIVCSDCGAVKSQGASRDASSPQRPSPPPATSRYCVVCDRIKDDSGETLGWALCECGSFRQPATTSRT